VRLPFISCVLSFPLPFPLFRLLAIVCISVAESTTRYHFNSIAHDNSSLESTILTPPPSSPIPTHPLNSARTPTPITLTGTQIVHKFSYDTTGAARPGHEDDTPDKVWIAVGLWRCWFGNKKADLVVSVNVNVTSEEGEKEREKVESWWTGVVGGLRIIDWGLFGDEE
jgi:hypothetical protein